MASSAPAHPSHAASLPTYALETTGGDPRRLLHAEWLLANGLGGFAMGTALGVPTRRYHGLLVAAATPPVGRIDALHALADRVVLSPGTDREQAFDLSSFAFEHQPDRLHPAGFQHLAGFEHEPAASTCQWTYHVGEGPCALEIIRELTLAHGGERGEGRKGGNAACIRYFVRAMDTTPSRLPFTLEVRPLVAMRDFHALRRRHDFDRFATHASTDAVTLALDHHRLTLDSGGGLFHADPHWWYNFFYSDEAARGMDCTEDLFSPGRFAVNIDAHRGTGVLPVLTLFARFDDAPAFNPENTQHARRAHTRRLVEQAAKTAGHAGDDALAALVTAADVFVVKRDPDLSGLKAEGLSPSVDHLGSMFSIIAGYPWFSDWGRDTCIALPGLLLATRRFDEAKRVLLAFAALRRRGIIPNTFSDQSGQAEYNTVDASLWFVLACCTYTRASGDVHTFRDSLAPACLDILDFYRRGTDHQIGMDPDDFLVAAGSPATQLTWMDARRDGVVFTPRHGKAVEINALWHAALAELADTLGTFAIEPSRSADLRDLAAAVARSFRASFWNDPRNCLYDRLTPPLPHHRAGDAWLPEAELRPNQLFAVSLPHSPLSRQQQLGVLAAVKERLLTPVGVRTLEPSSPHYRPRYEGTMFERDRAYHNGTVWPWLLGPYAEGVLRAGNFSPESRREALAAITPLIDTLVRTNPADLSQRTPLGGVAEVYDAEPDALGNRRPEGCPMQAWSVAELLRVYVLCEAGRAAPK